MDSYKYIKDYFTPSAWTMLSDYEKRRFENLKRNYEMLKSTGITPKMPEFMQSKMNPKKQTHYLQGINNTQGKKIPKAKFKLFAVPTQSNRKKKNPVKEGASLDICVEPSSKSSTTKTDQTSMISLRAAPRKDFAQTMLGSLNKLMKLLEKDLASRDKNIQSDKKTSKGKASEPECRYPKRNIKKMSYKEEDISSDDEFLHCDDCDLEYKGACPVHGPMLLVCDTKVSKDDPDKATRTLPSFFSISCSSIPKAGLGVWTEMFLHKGMVFGPYKGTLTTNHKDAGKTGYAWQVWKGPRAHHYIEGAEKDSSNWLRFVNCADREERQNVVAFQYKKAVYYRTYKDVLPYTELLVWYGDGYAVDLGIDLTESKDLEPPRDVGGFECDVCGALFSSSSAMEGHRRRHPHMRPDLRHRCPECSYSTNRTDDLRRHLLTHSGERPHACTHCRKTFVQKSVLRKHLLLHTGEKPFPCRTCGRGFNQSASLRRHERTHRGEKPHRCHTCGKDFTTAQNLKYHDRTHTQQRPYKCPHCDHRSTQPGDLHTHVRRMHTRDFKHACAVCRKGFVTPSLLKKHAEREHPTRLTEDGE